MIVISSGYEDVKNYISENIPTQILSNVLAPFFVFQNTKKGVLRFNTFSGEFVLLKKKEYLKFFNSNNCTVSSYKYVDDFRINSPNSKGLSQHVSTYTIFPTTGCNARCPYCFEKERKISNMSIETAHNIVDYIYKHSEGNTVNIRWFGGEPLLKFDAINAICSSLHRLNVIFTSSMATNGLLFKEYRTSDIINLMNLRQVQITIDGTEEVYNKVKGYIDHPNNPFQQILDNIQDLSSHSMLNVLIRLNINADNINDLITLVTSVLIPRFGKCKNVKIHTHLLNNALYDISSNVQDILFCEWNKLDNLIENNGMSIYKKLPSGVKQNRCIVDSGDSITILPDGKIGLCEHYTTTHHIGHIDSDWYNQDEIQYLRTHSQHMNICDSCVMYPQCIRLSCCPDANYCSQSLIERHIRNLRSSMLVEFKSFLDRNARKMDDYE